MIKHHFSLIFFLLICVLVFGAFWVLFPSFPFFPTVSSAAGGAFASYREAIGGETVPTSLTDQTWDTIVFEGAPFSLEGNTSVSLADVGHYLVLYNLGLGTGGGSNRSEIQGIMNLGGVGSAYGRSSCYIRRTQGADECWLFGSAILDATVGQSVKIAAQRTDSNSATVIRRSNESGFMLLKLDDSWNYARIRLAVGGQSFSSTTFSTVLWDTDDELDTGSFSRSNGDITLLQSGHYLVTANVMFRNSGTSSRRNINLRLVLDNGTIVEIPGTVTSAYLPGTNSTQDHAAVYSGIIEATTPGSILRVQAACEGELCGGVTAIEGQSGITIAKLPDTADFVRIRDIAGGQAVDGTDVPILWNTEDEEDAVSFSHDNVSNTSRVAFVAPGDYLLFGSFYSYRSLFTDTTRQYPHWEWRTNGTSVREMGSFGQYNRGDASTTGTFSSGSSGGIILPGMNGSDYAEIINTDEATGTDPSNTFQIDRYAMQGVRLATLFPITPSVDLSVTAFGPQALELAIPSASAYVGGTFVLSENTGGRSVTGITLTETGTVNGQNGLGNIKLFYENDATAPYDCADQSFAGTEAQFGLTDPDGFSGPNGTSVFLGNVPVNTSSWLCVYVVLDVLPTAVNGETIELQITNPATDVTVDAGSVGPVTIVALAGGTTLLGPSDLRQVHYRWLKDDGGEGSATFLATEDTTLADYPKATSLRLRFEISNEGGFSSGVIPYRIEVSQPNPVSCVAATYTAVDIDTHWDMALSSFFSDGDPTINIVPGLTDENTTFVAGSLKESSDQTSGISLAYTNFTEIEYALSATGSATSGANYCFRLRDGGGSENIAYNVYAQISLQGVGPTQTHFLWRNDNGGEGVPKWRVQSYQGSIGGTTEIPVVITPISGLDRAFVLAPAGKMSIGRGSVNGNQNANEVLARARLTALNTVTVTRESTGNDTYYSFFVVENPNGDEIFVKSGTAAFVSNADADLDIDIGSGVTDFTKTVVFLTTSSDSASRLYYHQAHVRGFMSSNTVLSLRRTAGNSIATVDWFVVEFRGSGWNVQQGNFFLTNGTNASPQLQSIAPITPGNAFVFMNWEVNANGLDQTSAKVELFDTTTLRFSRQSSTAGTVIAQWFVLEHSNLSVRRGSALSGTGLTHQTLVAPPIGATRAIPITFNDNSTTGTLFPGSYWRVWFPDTATLFWDRARTGTVSNFFWQIIEFPATTTGGATLATSEDAFFSVDKNNSKRVRIQISNEGTSATDPIPYRLEVSQPDPVSCASGTYSRVNFSSHWTMVASAFFTDGDPTVNIFPGLTDENPTFRSGELKEVTDESGAISLSAAEFTELEYSVQASAGSVYGARYCFRLTNAGVAGTITYNQYAEARVLPVAFEFSAFRWYENQDGTTVTTPLASENTAATLDTNGKSFRLRMLLHVGDVELRASGENLKLQSAQKSGQCDVAFLGETYSDVTALSPIGYRDNSAPLDGDPLTPNVLIDPKHLTHQVVYQTYEEANVFTNTQGAVQVGQDGMWDFALFDLSASSLSSYCFRVVKNDGIPLSTYSVLPEITVATAFAPAGTYESNAFNTGAPNAFNVIAWNWSLSNPVCVGCTVYLQIKTAVDAGGVPGAWSLTWAGPDGEDGDETDFFTVSTGERIHTDHNQDQWVRYRASLTGDGTHSAVLEEVQVNYQ